MACLHAVDEGGQYLCLSTEDGHLIFELQGEDFDRAVRDGLLSVPDEANASPDQWLSHALSYAADTGLLPKALASSVLTSGA